MCTQNESEFREDKTFNLDLGLWEIVFPSPIVDFKCRGGNKNIDQTIVSGLVLISSLTPEHA